ncbi:MAG: TIGR02281 family clan AA aspartic protease [Alphaproteobacteria bacterium]|nr:TIGR02281 family clan AA aspartic protease [Alphaproteobacteria bacterium]
MLGMTFKLLAGIGLAVFAAHMAGIFDLPVAAERDKVSVAIAPAETDENAVAREIRIDAHQSGHFLVDVAVNGVELPFMVDTGASLVTLSKQDAERAGIETAWLDYTERMQTANGIIRAAPVELDELRIGDLELRDVKATINESPMGISLLGLSFLERLDGYEVRNETLLLRW